GRTVEPAGSRWLGAGARRRRLRCTLARALPETAGLMPGFPPRSRSMPRKPTIAVFATLAISSLAFAAGLQHPADQARTHPGSSAHANAVAGAAAARRIEACGNAASAMIRNLETGDAEAATADFDATMHANLDAGRLGTVWK